MATPQPHAADDAAFPRVPTYAWSWLQRTRPVLWEAARRLTGQPPAPGFVDELRSRFSSDPFVRDVVIGVVCDVAFNGRLPRRRPPGAAWDRGLTWWAAAIAGVTPSEFEGRAHAPAQRALFDADPPPSVATAPRIPPQPHRVRWGTVSTERAALVAALRALLRTAEDEQIPAAAVRQLLEELERD